MAGGELGHLSTLSQGPVGSLLQVKTAFRAALHSTQPFVPSPCIKLSCIISISPSGIPEREETGMGVMLVGLARLGGDGLTSGISQVGGGWTHCPCYSVAQLCRLFATPWTAARQASLSCIISWSSLKFMSIESVMPSNHLILCRPLLLLPSIFPSIRVFSSESVLRSRWPKYWSFSFSNCPSNEYSALFL